MQYILPNKLLWYIAVANVFVYLLRYGILDWSPTYLKEVKHFALDKSSWAYFLYEYAGIPGTLLCGWMSDKVFKGNRGATGVFFMTLVTIATVVYWLNPPGNPGVDMACMIIIGFLIYGPVMLIGLHALELAPKKPPAPPRASPACSAISAVPWPRAPSSAIPSISSAGTAALW
jgi:OPA family glycerol-3-phosphate transporter-like MFS transporter